MKSSVNIIRKPLSIPRGLSLKVGILDGSAPSDDGESTVGQIAEKHEYGLGVPQRSWLRQWFDERGSELEDDARELMGQAVEAGDNFEATAGVLALRAEASVKNRITEGQEILPITSPVTIARKQARGYNPPYTPLVETGLLLSSITAEAKVIL